jgi:predicted CXXCH cytochrome family protein
MPAGLWLLVPLILSAILLLQLRIALGRGKGTLVGLALLLVLGGFGWWLKTDLHTAESAALLHRRSPDRESARSDDCFKCHADHDASWRRTYHRTMTREASVDTVKGDFNDSALTFQGVTSRMTREGGDYFMETLDPSAAADKPRLRRFKVDRLVGSHWFQECLFEDDSGRYWRLPLSYHIVEGRWVHTNGAFLAPDTDDFWSKSTVWNESCVFCHNTKVSKQPVAQPWRGRRATGYDTSVVELGIACEACHGPGGEHIRANQNFVRRLALQTKEGGDPTIVNPKRLSVERRDDICAHCHGALVPKGETWDPLTLTDPYNAGDDLKRFNYFFSSEAEQGVYYGKRQPDPANPTRPEPLDGRFWRDGTPLTTALEYNGLALSACYERGHGQLSCLSCHSMHASEPNFMLAHRMETNEACCQCHEPFRQRLTEHTHHPADSPGSLCYNCHMPYVVFSLLTTHRSHRIERPRVRDSLGTGKPHACNLCHLDKSLGWTQDRLKEWYGRQPEPLAEDEQRYASSLLHLTQSDARTRAVVAGAFSWSAAQRASGKDWAGPLLTRVLAKERYPAVRYLAFRGLRSLYGIGPTAYDYLAGPKERGVQLAGLGPKLEATCRPATGRYPHLPLDSRGQVVDTIFDQLLKRRDDPDVSVHE